MIILTQGKSRISRTINFMTWSKYSHMAEAKVTDEIRDKIGDPEAITDYEVLHDIHIVEAWHAGGVRVENNISAAHKKGTVIDFYDMPAVGTSTLNAVFDRMATQEGKGYDLRGVFRFAHHRGREEYNSDGNAADKWFCSELGYWAWYMEWGSLLQYVLADCFRVAPKHIAISPYPVHVRRVVVGSR